MEKISSAAAARRTQLSSPHRTGIRKTEVQHGVLTDANWYATGHYTQMVWKNTAQVGIGQANCAGGGSVIAAEYHPPGNYMGEKPY